LTLRPGRGKRQASPSTVDAMARTRAITSMICVLLMEPSGDECSIAIPGGARRDAAHRRLESVTRKKHRARIRPPFAHPSRAGASGPETGRADSGFISAPG
jgi:hypothetical protein